MTDKLKGSEDSRLTQALEYTSTLIRSSPDGVLAVDLDLRITEWNLLMEQMCGKSREQEIGQNLADIPFMKETGEGARIREGLEGKAIGPREVTYRIPGEDAERFFESVMAPLRGPAGEIVGAVLRVRDITERKQAQQALAESEALLSGVFDSVQDGIVVAEAQSQRLLMVNPAICRMLGYSREELLTMFLQDAHPRKDHPRIAHEFERMIKDGGGLAPAMPVQRKDGSIFYADINAGPMTIKGAVCIVGILRDITERKQAEEEILTLNQSLEQKVQQLLTTQEELEQHRAHLEQEVARQTAGLTDAQRIAHLGNWEWDLINNTLNWSDEMYRIFGLAPQQFGANYEAFLNAVHPEDRQLVDDTVREALARQHTYSIEHRILQSDGTLRYVHAQAEVMQGDDGQPISMVGTLQDITERKLAEQTAMDERNFSDTLIASQPDVFYVFDQSGRFIRWNQKLKEILGLSDAQLVVTNALDVIHEADRPVVAQKIQETFEQGAATINARLITKIGIRDYVFNATSAETEKGMYLIGVGTDITERNCAEEKLRRSDTHLAEAQQISHVGSWEMDHVTNKIHWSVEAFRIFEQDPASFVPNFETFLDTVHPDDRDMLKETFGRSLQEHTPYEIEHRLLIKDGRIKYVHEQGSTIYDEQGRPLSTVGTVQDITDRIQSDRQIKIFRSLLDSAPDEIQVVDPATLRIIDVNESACIKLGYTREEFLALRAPDIDTAEPETHRANGERLLKDGFATFETRHKRKDGTTFPVEITLRIVTLDQPYTLAIARDITERKRAEQVLVDNEAKFRTVTNAVMDAILMIDDDGLIVSWNPAAERILGYSVQDAIGRNAHQLFVPSRYYADFKKGFASFRETGLGPVIGKKLELDALRKDGSEFPVELLISAIRLNERWHAVGIVRDITERKRVEAEVQKLQEQLREQALHDPLTGLYNRRYLDETIKRELARAERYNLPVGIVMCDLDHFKHVNDTHGHLAGDEVLRLFAELLKNHARGSDIVCRFGGEEFVMLLPDMPPAVTYQRAEQLRTEFAAKQIRLGAAVIQVTASFGVATFPDNGKTMDSLISAVDAAMYQAKETGRNRVVIASAHEQDVPDRTKMDTTEVSSRKNKKRTDGH